MGPRRPPWEELWDGGAPALVQQPGLTGTEPALWCRHCAVRGSISAPCPCTSNLLHHPSARLFPSAAPLHSCCRRLPLQQPSGDVGRRGLSGDRSMQTRPTPGSGREGDGRAGSSSQMPPGTACPTPQLQHAELSTGTGGRQGTQPQLHMDLQQSQEQVQVPQTPRSANSSQQRPEPGYAQRGLRDPYGPKQTLHYGADPTACPGQAAPALSLQGGCGGRSGATGTACMGTATLQPCSSRGDA